MVCIMPGQGLRMQMFPALPEPAGTTCPISSRISGKIPGMPGPALPGFMGSIAGFVLQRKPPFSVCHHVSTMTASRLPTVS